MLGGDEMMRRSRTPEIMADAAYAILTCPSKAVTGQFFVDELCLRALGTETGRTGTANVGVYFAVTLFMFFLVDCGTSSCCSVFVAMIIVFRVKILL